LFRAGEIREESLKKSVEETEQTCSDLRQKVEGLTEEKNQIISDLRAEIVSHLCAKSIFQLLAGSCFSPSKGLFKLEQ